MTRVSSGLANSGFDGSRTEGSSVWTSMVTDSFKDTVNVSEAKIPSGPEPLSSSSLNQM